MQKTFSKNMFGVILRLLILGVLAKSISFGLLLVLPNDGVDFEQKKNYSYDYQRVDFRNMLTDHMVVKPKTTQSTVKNTTDITNMILKGLYGKDSDGFVVVALKSSPMKTSIVSIGENFCGYVLKSIHKNSVVFAKNSKEYILRIKVSKKTAGSKAVFSRVAEDSQSIKSVSRDDIKYYTLNPKKVWQDISIMPLKDGKNVKGFKVMKIVKNSKIARLGLKKGDVIIRANNKELNSFSTVFDIYSNIGKLKSVDIVVLRNGEEKEFVYEID